MTENKPKPWDKTELYDTHIEPLMEQVHKKCLELGIPYLSTFHAMREITPEGMVKESFLTSIANGASEDTSPNLFRLIHAICALGPEKALMDVFSAMMASGAMIPLGVVPVGTGVSMPELPASLKKILDPMIQKAGKAIAKELVKSSGDKELEKIFNEICADDCDGRFELGQVVMTAGVKKLVDAGEILLDAYLGRHASGDWGDVTESDAAQNEAARKAGEGDRIMSAYRFGKGEDRIWIITDRNGTTALLPEEY